MTDGKVYATAVLTHADGTLETMQIDMTDVVQALQPQQPSPVVLAPIPEPLGPDNPYVEPAEPDPEQEPTE